MRNGKLNSRVACGILRVLAVLVCACKLGVVSEANAQAARSHIVVDPDSRKILSGYQINERRQIASLTKVATAVVVLDWSALSGVDLSVEAIVPPSALATGGVNPLGLLPGDRISLRDALYATLIGSDNVSAQTLANFVGADLLRRSGKRIDPVVYFVAQMNALARKLGMEETRFVNPHGMDHAKPVPYSTAADVARLSIEAMSRAPFRFFVGQSERKVSYRRGQDTRAFMVRNTNELVVRTTIDGVKTGMTRRAGPCLALSGTREPIVTTLPDGRKQVTPRRLIVVVLGARDRFGMAQGLLDRGWQQFDAWNAGGRRITGPEQLLSRGER